jgi:hypothetical protein
VPGLSSTTAAGLARRITGGQWQAVETGVAAVTGRMVALLPSERAAALTGGPVTIDLDATDVEVYGRKKRGVAYNHQGQRVGRPHVAAWAETEIVLAADLGSGTDDPRATAPDLLRRALACRPGPGAGWRCAPTPATSPGSSPASRMFGVLILAIYLVASRRGVEEGRISLSTKISKAEFSWKKHPKD